MTVMSPPTKHALTEDLQGLGLGVFLCSIAIHILTQLGLITGQTAGIAAILSYLTGWTFGTVFFAINLPFYLFAYRRLGLLFTVKSLLSVSLLSLGTMLMPLGFQIGYLHPALGAMMFGSLTGLGLLAMFRHGGSLGGLGVVALLVQDNTGFRAGYVQLLADAVIFAVAFFLFPTVVVLWSLMGAVVLNMIIAINHRRDRYIAA